MARNFSDWKKNTINMTTTEIENKLKDIIKNNKTKVNVPKISTDGINSITITTYNVDNIESLNKVRKIITRKEDVEKIINYINSKNYKYCADMKHMKWSPYFNYSIEVKGDKEYFIGFLFQSRLKYNDWWYMLPEHDNFSTETIDLYKSMNYKEEELEINYDKSNGRRMIEGE